MTGGMRTVRAVLTVAGLALVVSAQEGEKRTPLAEGKGYRIDQPGTITFTTGVKIKGKVEKPQVMILLPKEKPTYREMSLSHTFKPEVTKPLPFTPITP